MAEDLDLIVTQFREVTPIRMANTSRVDLTSVKLHMLNVLVSITFLVSDTVIPKRRI